MRDLIKGSRNRFVSNRQLELHDVADIAEHYRETLRRIFHNEQPQPSLEHLRKIEPGERVKWRAPPRRSKLEQRFDGPFEIVEPHGTKGYKIRS